MFDYKFDENAIIYELRLENSNVDVQREIIENIYERLYERMRSRVVVLLSEDEMKYFEKLSDEQANAWLTARFPNSNEMFEEELQLLVGEMRDFVDSAEAGASVFKDPEDQ